ncbi:MAG: hypothetical protein MUF15_19395 [Acidobacteria bacterium]|nr:hypothetical protein [Acidobacteriota bacterium]
MMNDENLHRHGFESGLAAEIIAAIADKAIKKYKIDVNSAAGIIRETVEKHPKSLQLLSRGLSLKEILKTRVYDEIEKKAQCKIYYQLRQYQKTGGARESLAAELATAPGADYNDIIKRLAQSHVSTKERLNSLDEFYREIFKPGIKSITKIPGTNCN